MAQTVDGGRPMSGRSSRTTRVRIPAPALRVRVWLSQERRRPSKLQVLADSGGSNPSTRASSFEKWGRGARMAQNGRSWGGLDLASRTTLARFVRAALRPAVIWNGP